VCVRMFLCLHPTVWKDITYDDIDNDDSFDTITTLLLLYVGIMIERMLY
jgi:hypothetical protein